MNWLQKTAQQSLLVAKDQIQTPKLGPVYIELQCSYEDYDRWWKYKTGGQGWNDKHIGDPEAHNRSIAMEPDIRLHITHDFAEMMPRVNRPKRTPFETEQMDAFDMIGDRIDQLGNDDFYQTVKIQEVGEEIRSWLFMKLDGPGRADPKDRDLGFSLSTVIFGLLEELFQQYTARI